eukprot:4605791-Karenia_brevis.AAC.1
MAGLPPVLPVQTPEKVPRRARKRIGKLQASAMDSLMMQMDAAAGLPTEGVMEMTMICKLLYAMLARREKREPGADDKAHGEAQQWKILRKRLQLAEAGMWHVLVDHGANE